LNAPGGIADYAQRYGRLFHEMMKDVKPEPWDGPLIAKVEQERRTVMPVSDHAARQVWRDRRLMALVAHKRAAEEKG
jgi:hypothetical protein